MVDENLEQKNRHLGLETSLCSQVKSSRYRIRQFTSFIYLYIVRLRVMWRSKNNNEAKYKERSTDSHRRLG